jgi:hypothetical protein
MFSPDVVKDLLKRPAPFFQGLKETSVLLPATRYRHKKDCCSMLPPMTLAEGDRQAKVNLHRQWKHLGISLPKDVIDFQVPYCRWSKPLSSEGRAF